MHTQKLSNFTKERKTVFCKNLLLQSVELLETIAFTLKTFQTQKFIFTICRISQVKLASPTKRRSFVSRTLLQNVIFKEK